jgi:RHS repeat-associated protein
VGSQGTVYHYDTAGNLIAETDTSGVTQRTYVWADGQPLAQIEAITTPIPDLINDNPQASFTGSWATSTGITGFYGSNYRTNTKGIGRDKAVWAVNVPSTGTYQVYVRHVAASTHASNAPFTIKHSTGSQTLAVNQRTNNGQWMLLGSYAFTQGAPGSVTLTDKANGKVIADAIKLVATSGGITQEAVRYLHGDHLNTPRLATNAAGVKVWSWEGTAFGSTPPNEDPDGDGKKTVIDLRFAGQLYDGESGLFYNWNRYYDLKVGRYISSDPVGLKGGLNTYSYVSNNPLRFVDPFGLTKWTGTAMAASIAAPIGMGGMLIEVKTKCINNKRGYVKALGIGPAAGIGFEWLPGSGTSGSIEFDDYLIDVIDPNQFNGRFGTSGANLVIGGGPGHGIVQCGHAFSQGSGWSWGIDVGATGIIGTCTVLESRIEDCCEK